MDQGGAVAVVGLIAVDPKAQEIALVDATEMGKRVLALPSRGLTEGESPHGAAVQLLDEVFGDVATTNLPDEPTFLFEFTRVGARHAYYRVPLERQAASDRVCFTPISEALHLPIRPHIVAETVLQAAVTDEWPTEPTVVEDAWSKPPERIRAGMIVVCSSRLLVIAREHANGHVTYELPGGGVDVADATPASAAERELKEETGLALPVGQQLALVHEMGWFHHYLLPAPDAAAALTLAGAFAPEDPALSHGRFGRPVWLSPDELRNLDLWPRRLAWRIATWIDTGQWPSDIVELTDSVRPGTPCSW